MDDVESRTYTTPQIAAIIDKSLHKTISYINRGYIEPSIQDASGHGSRRLWSYLDVVRMAFIMHLEDVGIAPAKMRQIARKMADDGNMGRVADWVIHGGMESGEIDIWHIADPDEEYFPSVVPISDTMRPKRDLKFENSPVKVIVSMNHLHQWTKAAIRRTQVT